MTHTVERLEIVKSGLPGLDACARVDEAFGDGAGDRSAHGDERGVAAVIVALAFGNGRAESAHLVADVGDIDARVSTAARASCTSRFREMLL